MFSSPSFSFPSNRLFSNRVTFKSLMRLYILSGLPWQIACCSTRTLWAEWYLRGYCKGHARTSALSPRTVTKFGSQLLTILCSRSNSSFSYQATGFGGPEEPLSFRRWNESPVHAESNNNKSKDLLRGYLYFCCCCCCCCCC
jgi:hypothetical protein